MAEILRTKSPTVHRDSHSTIYQWTGVATGDTMTAVVTGHAKEVSISINSGTIGSGSVALQGTLDPDYANSEGWVSLPDHAGTTIGLAAVGLATSREMCNQFRPVLSGSGTSGLEVLMQVRHV